jgi:hypothetical protein
LPAISNIIFKKYLKFRQFKESINGPRPLRPENKGYTYLFAGQTDVKLVRYSLEDNGFRETN